MGMVKHRRGVRANGKVAKGRRKRRIRQVERARGKREMAEILAYWDARLAESGRSRPG